MDDQAPPQATQPVTVKDLDKLVEEIAAKRVEIDDLAEKTTQKNKEMMALQTKAFHYLRELGRDDYKTPIGTIGIKTIWNVTNPKTEEDKALLFNWMRARGIYDAYATVNAASLKSLVLAEREAYIKSGGDPMLFSVPGVEPPKFFEIAQFTKARKSS